jgi:hypothetical protein
MMRGQGAPGAAITATERYVYVLRGRTLYSFDARTLREVARVDLRDEAPGAPGTPRAPGAAPAP